MDPFFVVEKFVISPDSDHVDVYIRSSNDKLIRKISGTGSMLTVSEYENEEQIEKLKDEERKIARVRKAYENLVLVGREVEPTEPAGGSA